MNSREVTLWLDERWCNALESATGKTMDTLMKEQADTLIQTLPKEQLDEIAAEIQREEQQEAREAEARRRFSVFRVAENGSAQCYLAEHREDFLGLGIRLRQFLRSDAPDVSQLVSKAAPVPLELFEQYTAEMVGGSPRVTGVFDLDLDSGKVSTLDPRDGWHCYRVKDVSAAVYFAMKPQGQWWKRGEVFQKRLEGKELTDISRPVYIRGEHRLPVDTLAFQDEVSEIGHMLNFYIPVSFDPDKVFGTHVATARNDDYLNVYADYDLKSGKVLDTLQVCLIRGDGSELDCQYRLTPEEQETLRSRMDSYCVEQLGLFLEQASERYVTEEMSGPVSHKPDSQGLIMEQTM